MDYMLADVMAANGRDFVNFEMDQTESAQTELYYYPDARATKIDGHAQDFVATNMRKIDRVLKDIICSRFNQDLSDGTKCVCQDI